MDTTEKLKIHSYNKSILKQAYFYCLNIAKSHYENFSVASRFLPNKFRNPISAIYAFARTADDYADEGNQDKNTRLNKLQNLYNKIEQIPYLITEDYILIALQDSVIKYKLSKHLLLDLLIAFQQDVTKNRYNDFNEVLDYCKHSANPIGRLLLELTGYNSIDNNNLSDNICTGLQLINFMQDINSDLTIRNRCYLPMDELAKYNIDLISLQKNAVTEDIQEFINVQLQRIEKIYFSGMKLGDILPGIFGFELRMMIIGGAKILQDLKKRENPYFRPTISKLDKINIFLKALIGGI